MNTAIEVQHVDPQAPVTVTEAALRHFRQQIAGVREATPYDTTAYAPQPNPALPEFGDLKLAQDEKEQLLLELFPSVADKYLRTVRAAQWAARPRPEPIQDETWDYWESVAQSMGA
mgnify:CR=1 FL=1